MNVFKDLIDYVTKLFTWWVVIMPWEQGIRVTFGKKCIVLNEGMFLKLPLVHKIYVQEKRLRVLNLPVQTVSTRDGFALTISCSVGYSIVDIHKLYNTLYQPDMSIQNIVSSKVSEFISKHDLQECKPSEIESKLNESIQATDYGLKYDYVKIINFAHVKTFRLIQDQSYMYEGLNLVIPR